MAKHNYSPESLMMSYGYKPELSEGAVKPPIFQTSTFVFKTAEEGKAFFEVAYGLREKDQNEELGLIYSRINNPNLEILENRLCLWDKADDCAVFESGMSAISTVLLEFLKPGDVLLYSSPVYGGTDHFIHHFLPKIGIDAIGFSPDQNEKEIIQVLIHSGKLDKLAMIYVETPANPTNAIIDISICQKIAEQFSTNEKKVHVAVDNTYMGPLWSHPLQLGADIVIYSATKYIGGHSDVVIGAIVVNDSILHEKLSFIQNASGATPGPMDCFLTLRGIKTLHLRMQRHSENAEKIAMYLKEHKKIKNVYWAGFKEHKNYKIAKSQMDAFGGMVSFIPVDKTFETAKKIAESLKLFTLAESLGGVESLCCHPASMTHASIPVEEREKSGLVESLLRLSVGIEDVDDLIDDLNHAIG